MTRSLWPLLGYTHHPLRPPAGRGVPFVGRETELRHLAQAITQGAGGCYPITGAPGVGVRAFVTALGASLAPRGYLLSQRSIRLGLAESRETLLVALLEAMTATVLAAAPAVVEDPVVQGALEFLDVWRTHSPLPLDVVAMGQGTPDALPEWTAPDSVVPPLLADLVAFARDRLGARGVLVVWALDARFAEADRRRLGHVLAACQDVLHQEGVHHLWCDHDDTFARTVAMQPSLASLVTATTTLSPLPEARVHEVLAARSAAAAAVTSPQPLFTPTALAATVRAAGGDLATTIRALTAVLDARGGLTAHHAPLALRDCLQVWRAMFATALRDATAGTTAEGAWRIVTWQEPEVSQPALTQVWGLTRASATAVLVTLAQLGVIAELPADGRMRRYRVTAWGRLLALTPSTGTAGPSATVVAHAR